MYNNYYTCIYLKALAELESNWWSDVEEVVSGNSEISQVFFYGLQQEVHLYVHVHD